MAEFEDIIVRFGLDSDQFTRGVAQLNRQTKLIESEFRAASAKLGGFGSSTEQLRLKTDALSRQIEVQRQKFDTHKSAIQDSMTKVERYAQATAEVKTRLDQARAAHEASAQAIGRDAAETQRLENEVKQLEQEYRRQSQALTNANNALENHQIRANQAETTLVRLENELRQTSEQIRQQTSVWTKLSQTVGAVSEKMKAAGEKISSIGRDLTAKVTTPIVGLGTAAVATVAKFDDGMSKVQAITGATAEDMGKLRQQAKDLGRDTKFSASQVADAYNYLGMAGWDANKIMTATPALLNLAAAGAMDLGRAADIVSDTMAQFNLEAEQAGHAADIFAKAQASANLDVQMLGETMKYAGPVANAFGMSLEEASAVAMIFANNGIKASEAGTAMRAGLTRLAKPPKDAADALAALNVVTADSKGKMLPMEKIVAQLSEKFKGLSQEQQIAAAKAIFGQEAMAAWITLISAGPKELNKFTVALRESDGAADKMAKTMEDNIGGSFRSLKSAIEGAAISIGERLAPTIRKIADFITGLTRQFAQLNPAIQNMVIAFGLIAAAIGPVLLVIGQFVMSIGAIGSAIAAAFGAIAGVGGLLAVLTGPIGLVAGLTLATGAVVAYTSATKDSTKVSMDHYNELGKQARTLDTTIEAYDKLHNRLKLTDDEMLAYMDIQKELQNTTNPEKIKSLTSAMDQLQKKSGLSKDELQKLISLSKELQEQAPDTEKAISNSGNAWAKNTDEAKKYRDQILENQRIELETQQAKAKANFNDDTNAYLDAHRKVNAAIDERNGKLQNVSKQEEYIKQIEEERAASLKANDQERATVLERVLETERVKLSEMDRQFATAQSLYNEAVKELDAKDKVLQKSAQIYDQMKQNVLAQVGLTAKVGEEGDVLQQNIKKLQEERNQIIQNAGGQDKVTGKNKERLGVIDKEINKYVEAQGAISQMGKEQDAVKRKVEETKRQVGELNQELGKPITKSVTIVQTINNRINTDVNPGIKSYFDNKNNMNNAGKDTVGGFISGMNSREGDVKKSASNIAGSVPNTAKKTLDIRSPSRVMDKIGQETGKGLAQGISKKEKEVKKSSEKLAKQAEKAAKDAAAKQKKAFEESMKTADYNFKMGKVDLSGYIKSLENIQKTQAKTTDQVQKVTLAIKKAEADLAKQLDEINKKKFESSKKWIDERKYYNELTLEQELAAWKRVADSYKQGTEQRIEADREIYRVKKEMERASFENSKRWIDEQKYYNKLSLDEELAAWRRVQARYKAGTAERKEADREVYRVQIELLNKAAEDKYKATMDDIERETKAAQEIAQRQKEAIESRRDAVLDSLKREEKAEMDSLARRQKAYERDHQARMKMLDDETNAAIKRLQAEIDAIDKQGRDEDYAYKDADRQKELAELRKQYDKYKVSASAAGQKKAADLLKQIEKIQTEIERDEQARRREQQKESLKEQMDNIKETADKKKEQWQSEFDRQKEWFEQEKEQRQFYYQQREVQLKESFDAELRALEDSTKNQLAQLEQQKIDAEQTRTKMLEDAKLKARENLNVVESGQQQAINVLQSKNQDYYRSGQTLGNMFAYGLESSAARVKEAANKIAKVVSSRLELHSPAEEGPLSTLNKWWNAFSDTILEGLDAQAINAAMNAMVNPNLSFGSLGAVGAKAMVSTSSVKQEYNFERMFEGANFMIRDEQDIRSLGREFGSYIVNSTKTMDRARGRK